MTPSDEPLEPARAAAPRRSGFARLRAGSLVWAVPLAALFIVVFLGVRAVADRGTDVVVTFDGAADARVNDTKVVYRGITSGRVTAITINPDGRRVDLTLRIEPSVARLLVEDTRFWLIGATPSLNDLSSVKAALAGVTIGMAPGRSATAARHFDGSSEPPVVLPGTPGTSYVLSADALGTLSVGSPLFYRGKAAGKVTAIDFVAPAAFRLQVFVFPPFDALVRSSSLFWVSSPVQVTLTDKGASASLEHAGALLTGALEMDMAEAAGAAGQSAAGSVYPLYGSRRAADDGPPGPQVLYALRFSGPAGDLNRGAPIRLLGATVGTVKSVQLEVDPRAGTASVSVVAAIYPRKLRIQTAAGADDASAWRQATDAALARLLATGHRARLIQSPPVIGARMISLDTRPHTAASTLLAGDPPTIPSDDSGGDLEAITDQTRQFLAKLNAVPIEAIGGNLQRITARLDTLASSPALSQSLQHLNSTLAQADAMMSEVRPQVGPLVAKLGRAADEVTDTVAAAHGLLGANGAGAGTGGDAALPAAIAELTDAARSIRALADYLGRHPEALIRGRQADANGDASKGSK